MSKEQTEIFARPQQESRKLFIGTIKQDKCSSMILKGIHAQQSTEATREQALQITAKRNEALQYGQETAGGY